MFSIYWDYTASIPVTSGISFPSLGTQLTNKGSGSGLDLVPLYGSRTPNCWDSWSKFMKNSASSWVLYSFYWLPIVSSFLLIHGNPPWTFIHSLLTNRTKVRVSRISGPSLSWSIFQFLGCAQPHNLVIVVVIVVVSQVIISYNLQSIVSLYHTCFRQSSVSIFVPFTLKGFAVVLILR